MISRNTCLVSVKNRIQHHVLNWIVITRYQMVQRGFPKNATLKYLVMLENFLKKINVI